MHGNLDNGEADAIGCQIGFAEWLPGEKWRASNGMMLIGQGAARMAIRSFPDERDFISCQCGTGSCIRRLMPSGSKAFPPSLSRRIGSSMRCALGDDREMMAS
jgi:hypothetical protein